MSSSQKQPKKQPKFTRPTVAIKHKKVLDNLVENGGNLSKAIRDTGLYSEVIARDPQKITESITWGELMEFHISDSELASKHKELLHATRLDHMTFPTGCKTEADKEEIYAVRRLKAESEGKVYVETEIMTDDDIRELLSSVNCTVRRIVHGDTARHVYFWSADNKSRKDAVEMGYKLKGRFAPELTPQGKAGNTYNFIFSEGVQEKVKVIEAEIKQMLIKPHEPTN